MFSKIIALITGIPKLWDVIKDIGKHIAVFLERLKAKRKRSKMEEALDHAKKTKDTSKIEDILRGD